MNDLLDQVAQNIQRHGLLRKRERVLVAVSGGLDSMVLLEVLHRLARSQEHQWSLTVAHFNHQLRGRGSQADERLVRTRAQQLGWPCEVGQGRVAALARSEAVSIEMMARRLRHDFLARTARRERCTTLALAHHMDDQIELFWLRILRGTGPGGLAGMRLMSNSPADPRLRLTRPLLDQWRADLEEFAAHEHVRFREDSSNLDESIPRNRIRHRLLPLLTREYQPGLRQVLRRQIELLRAEGDYVEREARDWLANPSSRPFEQLPTALQRRCLIADLTLLGIEPDFELVERLRENAGIPVMIAPGHGIRRNESGRLERVPKREMRFREGKTELDLGVAGEIRAGGGHIQWRVQRRRPNLLRPKPGVEWFDFERVGRRVSLRRWRPGDRFKPSGLRGSAKLQDLFTNSKIPAAARRELLVATTAQGQIWWVQRLRIGEQFKVGQGTRRFLEWRWQPSSG